MKQTMQNKVEEILKHNPTMPRDTLIMKYMLAHTDWHSYDIRKFLAILDEVNIMNLLRYARKYREKLGIRDKVRDDMAEQERRYWPALPVLEPQSDLHDPQCECPICFKAIGVAGG